MKLTNLNDNRDKRERAIYDFFFFPLQKDFNLLLLVELVREKKLYA